MKHELILFLLDFAVFVAVVAFVLAMAALLFAWWVP